MSPVYAEVKSPWHEETLGARLEFEGGEGAVHCQRLRPKLQLAREPQQFSAPTGDLECPESLKVE